MSNLKLGTILVIDGRSRGLSAFFATVTKDANGSAVVRYASEGLVPQPRDDYEHGIFCPFPVLVMGAYSARSSAGHVHTVGMGGQEITVVGGLGKPFGKGGLRRLRRPIKSRLMPAGCTVHKWDGNSSSNPGTVGAAIEGISFMAEMQPNNLWLEEGQSDTVSFLKMVPSEDSAYPEFHDEHQRSVYDPAIAPVRDAIFSLLPAKEVNEYGECLEPTREEKDARKRQFDAAVFMVHDVWTKTGGTLPQLREVLETDMESFGSTVEYLRSRVYETDGFEVGVDNNGVFVNWTHPDYTVNPTDEGYPSVTERIFTIPLDAEEVESLRSALAEPYSQEEAAA